MTALKSESILTKEERRAKREARQEKQRSENADRAAKMHAARIAWEKEGELLPLQSISHEHAVHVGCSG